MCLSGCVRACVCAGWDGGWGVRWRGSFREQNVLYLFWPDAKHLKAFSWLEAL